MIRLNGEFLQAALEALATNAPSLFIVLAFMVIVFMMYNSSIKNVRKSYEFSIEHMQQAYNEAIKQIKNSHTKEENACQSSSS